MEHYIVQVRKVIFFLVLLLFISCDITHTKSALPEEETYVNGYGFSIDLPGNCRDVTQDDLGIALRKVEPHIIFLAIVELPDQRSLFSIKAFELGEAMPIDSAFIDNVNHKATFAGKPIPDYRVIDYGVRKRNNRRLHYKISFNPQTKYNVIYWVMKNDNSHILYEFGARCDSEAKLPGMQEFLEKVVLSSRFISDTSL